MSVPTAFATAKRRALPVRLLPTLSVHTPCLHTRPRRRGALLLLALSIAAMVFVERPAQAQLRLDGAPDQVQAGQRLNLFVDWDGRASLDGVLVELPLGWTLRQAQFVANGREALALEVTAAERGANAFAAAAPRRVQERGTVVLQVEVGGVPGIVTWAVTPYRRAERSDGERRRREASRLTHRMRQVAAMPSGDNHVLQFKDATNALLLRRAVMPDLSAEAAHTVEFWMKTLATDEVVLSTWTGDEQTAYPLEIVVGADGRLLYYRGHPGQHTAMKTTQPVADGRWHHVAVTHDPDAGWTRFLMNGVAVDSLYQPLPRAEVWREALALGGRVPDVRGQGTVAPAYSGALDEVRLWTTARSPTAIQRAMRRSVSSGPEVLVLDFEKELPDRLVERAADRARRVRSDLMFEEPISDFRAIPEDDGVTLTWTGSEQRTDVFLVERSSDGSRFEVVERIEPATGPASVEGVTTFRHHDTGVTDQVVYYRIRQRFDSGAERLSGTIKLGLGVEQAHVLLVGNYPNPFTRTTSIGYEVKEAQSVHLSVWDLSGQRIATLVNRTQQPGYYEVPFTPNDLPSGTYFVRLRTATGIQSHKMTLTK